MLIDNRKEASCVTVAGDRVRPRGRAWDPAVSSEEESLSHSGGSEAWSHS